MYFAFSPCPSCWFGLPRLIYIFIVFSVFTISCLHHLAFLVIVIFFARFQSFYYQYTLLFPALCFSPGRRFYFSFSFRFSTSLVFGLSFLAPVLISPLSCRSYSGRRLPLSLSRTHIRFLFSFYGVRYTFSFRLSRSHVRAVVAVLAPTVTMFSTYGCLSLSGSYAMGTIK